VQTRLFVVGLVALMALGSLALWTAIPVAWLWFTRDLQPDATRYIVVIVGCAVTMLIAAGFLYRLEATYARITGTVSGQIPARSAWLRSVSDERRSPRHLTLLDAFLVVSALLALVALVSWWAFLDHSPNPSGPTAPGTEHGV
jgi:hypothetical protein